MRIVEIFHSRQGEGRWTGTPSVFIRVGGCNLACRFCDTPYAAWERREGEDLTPDEIAGRVLIYDCEHVVLTGGEPMLYAEMVPLTRILKDYGKTITVETAGTLDLDVVCDLMSLSPKLSNATPPDSGDPVDSRRRKRHEANRFRPDLVRRFLEKYDCQLKFVVDRPEDFTEVEQYLELITNVAPKRVFLMPQGTELSELKARETWIRPYCEERGFGFSPRMQVEWYGNVRRT